MKTDNNKEASGNQQKERNTNNKQILLNLIAPLNDNERGLLMNACMSARVALLPLSTYTPSIPSTPFRAQNFLARM